MYIDKFELRSGDTNYIILNVPLFLVFSYNKAEHVLGCTGFAETV